MVVVVRLQLIRVDKSEKGETTAGSVRESKVVTESTSGASTGSSEPTTDGKDNELVQSVAKFIQAQTDMMAAQTSYLLFLISVVRVT